MNACGQGSAGSLARASETALDEARSERQIWLVHVWVSFTERLRFSNIMEPHDYARFAAFSDDARSRKWNLWGYVDARDVAQSCRLGLEADIQGAEAFIIAAADTVMNRPSRDLLAEVFPGVPLKGEIEEFETLLAIKKARKLLGYQPQYSWRNA